MNRVLSFFLFLAFFQSSVALAQSDVPPWRRSGTKVKVKVESVPVGAQVYIEDKKWGVVGTTPTEYIRLPRNSSYKVILSHPDMEDFEMMI